MTMDIYTTDDCKSNSQRLCIIKAEDLFTSAHWRHMEIHVKNRKGKKKIIELCERENNYVKM